MKTRLLKRVRKRFEIIHMPRGIVMFDEYFDYNLLVLVDHTRSLWNTRNYVQIGNERKKGRKFCEDIVDTEIEGINFLKNIIIERLRSEASKPRKGGRIKTREIKVWYN
jgi:hypothetical protein